jgi:hypothetical protein
MSSATTSIAISLIIMMLQESLSIFFTEDKENSMSSIFGKREKLANKIYQLLGNTLGLTNTLEKKKAF